MRRKVIKQANSAYTITLPIDWVRRNNIDKESEIDLKEDGKALVINSGNKIVGGKVKLDVTGFHRLNIYRYLNAYYSRGIDEIEITSKEDISSLLSKYLNQTLGYALVEQKEDKYLIKDLGGQGDQDLDEIFKRVFQMILLFYESAINDIFGERKETLEGLRARDLEINKFCLYLQRAINKMSYPDAIRGRALFTYSYELEKIGDEIQRAWRISIENKIKQAESIKKLAESSLDGLSKLFEAYYQFNSKKIEEIYRIREKVRGDSLKLIKFDGHTIRFIRHIVKIVEDAADLTHATLIMNLKE